jgi:flagellin-specific chaperone FliS
MKWRESLPVLLAEDAAKQRRLAELYTFLSAAYDSQDFPEVYASTHNVDEFVKHAMNFATEVKNDREKFNKYLSEIESLNEALKTSRDSMLEFSKKLNINLSDELKNYGGENFSTLNSYLQMTANAQAMTLDKQVKYLVKVDDKSREFMEGWEQVKKNHNNASTIVLNLVDILTGIGIGGAGLLHLLTRDVSKMTFARKWWDVGTNGGDVVDLTSVALSTYQVYNTLSKEHVPLNTQGAVDWIKNRVNELTGTNGNFQTLVSHINDYTRDKAQEWFDDWGWRDDMIRSRTHGYDKDKAWHNAAQNNPWLNVNEKQHLMMMDYHDYNPESFKGGWYDYNVDVLDWEKASHFAWQAHALYEWRKSDMTKSPPVTDQHWKDWVNWNWAIPEEEKVKLSNLPTNEWQALWNDWNKFLEYDKEPLYAHP